MENTQFREHHDGNSSSRGSYSGYDNDQSQRDGRHGGGGGRGQDRGGVRQPSRDSGGRGYDRGGGSYNRSYNNVSFRGNRGGYQSTGNRNQEHEERNDYRKRSRPHDKFSEDHIRDSSPDRNDRARHKDKQYEDHARDQSPDRSSNEQYTQGAEYGTNNKSVNWNQNQSQHYQGNRGNSGQGYQQGYDNQFDRKQHYYTSSQGQGRYDSYGNQQSSNWNYKRNKDWNQQEQYGYWDGNKQKEFQKDRRSRNWDEKSDIHLSKALSFLLRHGAEKQGYKLMPGGFLYVDEILQKQRNLQDYNLEDIQRIVKSNDKQRFFMEEDKETGKMKIRANQGHSLQVENLDLKPLVSHEEAPIVIHGTYHNSWEKIKLTGLSRMGRNHIHFAAGEPGENGVISGMRSSCEVMIYINLQKALEGGLKFFWSANNVILSPGNEDGVIPPAYFDMAVLRNPRQRLDFDQNVTIARVPVGGESLAQSKSKKKKKKKAKEEDEEKSEGTEKKPKKEKNEIDDSAIEDTGSLFKEEKIEVQEDVQKVVEKKEEKIEGQEEHIQRVVEKKAEKLEVEEENLPRVVEKMEVTEQKAPEKRDEVAEQKAPEKWDKVAEQKAPEKWDKVAEQKAPEKWDKVAEQKAPEKRDKVAEQKAPEKWDEDENYEDAPQDQYEEFHDAEDGSDVRVEQIVIEDAPASVSAVDYLKDQEVVVVYCDQSEDTFSKIVCAVSDKLYIFDIQKTPDIMSEGKLAEFFNNSQEPWKVFHGLTSKICATFFDKFEIILDGTKIFDLKVAYDIMNTQGLGNMTELKQTRYNPECVPTSLESCDLILSYLEGYQYLNKLMTNKVKDYKKQLFEMVNADIGKDEIKKLREQRKKELKKSSNKTPPKEQTTSKRKKKNTK